MNNFILLVTLIVAIVLISIVYIPKPYKYHRIVKHSENNYRVQHSYHGIIWWTAVEVIEYMGDSWCDVMVFKSEDEARNYIKDLKEHYKSKKSQKNTIIYVN